MNDPDKAYTVGREIGYMLMRIGITVLGVFMLVWNVPVILSGDWNFWNVMWAVFALRFSFWRTTPSWRK